MRSEEIAQYLQDNPQFFEEHADLISRMVIPHPHGGRTISITERQMLGLRDKNKLLEGKMGELLQFGDDSAHGDSPESLLPHPYFGSPPAMAPAGPELRSGQYFTMSVGNRSGT